MSTAHLLSEVNDEKAAYRRRDRMRRVLELMGWQVEVYDASVCQKTQVEAAESQFNNVNGLRASYSDEMASKLVGLPDGDLIIATAAWHQTVFRGLLDLEKGCYEGTPVVELWVDYLGCFAHWVVFANQFTLSHEMGRRGLSDWNPRWISALPHFEVSTLNSVNYEVYSGSPHSMEFIERMGQGVTPIAPDHGAWHEYIDPGVNGYLYRSQEGLEQKLNLVKSKPDVIDPLKWVAEHCSAEKAAMRLYPYLQQVSNA